MKWNKNDKLIVYPRKKETLNNYIEVKNSSKCVNENFEFAFDLPVWGNPRDVRRDKNSSQRLLRGLQSNAIGIYSRFGLKNWPKIRSEASKFFSKSRGERRRPVTSDVRKRRDFEINSCRYIVIIIIPSNRRKFVLVFGGGKKKNRGPAKPIRRPAALSMTFMQTRIGTARCALYYIQV